MIIIIIIIRVFYNIMILVVHKHILLCLFHNIHTMSSVNIIQARSKVDKFRERDSAEVGGWNYSQVRLELFRLNISLSLQVFL